MNKVIFKRVTHCNDCPYFRFEHETVMVSSKNLESQEESWYACGFTDRILIEEDNYRKLREVEGSLLEIPAWCPLEDYGLLHKAIEAIK